MSLSLIPLLLSIALYTSLIKLSALLYQGALLSWRNACIFSLILLMVLGAGTLLKLCSGHAIPLPLSIGAGLLIQVGIGAWFLAARARTAAGVPFTVRGAAMLSLIAYGLIASLGMLAALALRALRG